METTAPANFSSEELNRPGLLVLDIRSNSSPVVMLGGKVVVDARDKITSSHPRGWTDREQLSTYNSICNEVRIAFASGDGPEGMKKALLETASKFNIIAEDALIVGEAPEHWKPTNHISRRFVRRK